MSRWGYSHKRFLPKATHTSSLVKHQHSSSSPKIFSTKISASADLTLGYRSDPRHRNIERHDHDTADPETLGIICVVESEEDGEDNATQIAGGTGDTRKDAICEWVDMRHQGEIGAVACFKEDGHGGDETKELCL